uniref:WIBG Mago-binding domain-containing protein n=1 Tax=Mycena chlorophos TaxID=658473 RepID=A0ABQ0L9G0_MYCCL|nr:predicted protein [Mycena chlorophos]
MPPEGFVISPRRVPSGGVPLLRAKFEYKNNPPSAPEQKAAIEKMLSRRPGGLMVTSPPSSPEKPNTRSRPTRRVDVSPSKLPVAKKQKKADDSNEDVIEIHSDNSEPSKSSRTRPSATSTTTPASNSARSRPGPARGSTTSSVAPSSGRSTSAFTPVHALAGGSRPALAQSPADPFIVRDDDTKTVARRVSFAQDRDIEMEELVQVKDEDNVADKGKGKERAVGERPEQPMAGSSRAPASIAKIPTLSVAQKIQLAGQAQTAQDLQLRQEELDLRRQELEHQRGRLAFLLDLHRMGQLAQMSLVLRVE